MRYKSMFSACFLVMAMLLICNYANAAERFDHDVGVDKSIVKVTNGDNDIFQQLHVAAFEPAPALVRNKFEATIYREPKTDRNLLIWNARINHNYPFQIPGKAGPPLNHFPLRE